jgi:hypothetical protein
LFPESRTKNHSSVLQNYLFHFVDRDKRFRDKFVTIVESRKIFSSSLSSLRSYCLPFSDASILLTRVKDTKIQLKLLILEKRLCHLWLELEVLEATGIHVRCLPELWLWAAKAQLLHGRVLVANGEAIDVDRNRHDNLASAVRGGIAVAHVVRGETSFDAFPLGAAILEPNFDL